MKQDIKSDRYYNEKEEKPLVIVEKEDAIAKVSEKDLKQQRIDELKRLGEKRLRYPPNDIYYTPNKRKSYQPNLSIIIAARGPGKTFGELTAALRDYFRKGKKFVYVRRYISDMKEFVSKKTIQTLCDGVKTVQTGENGISYEFRDIATGSVMGYALVLSVAVKYKSAKFTNIGTIIFDEFILKPGGMVRYLNDEATDFMNLLSTIKRDEKEMDVVLLGNNEDLFNPYFIYFNIPRFDNIYWDSTRGIYIENYKPTDKWLNLQEKSALHQLTQGTRFANFAYQNEFINDQTSQLVRDKPHNAHLFMRAGLEKNTLNFYRCDINGIDYIYVEFKYKTYDNDDKLHYTIMLDGEYNTVDCKEFRNRYSIALKRFYYRERIIYSSKEAGNYFMFIMTNILK